MNELFNIKDYVVVITGGTGVLGRTIAKYLAKNGAKVIILGRKEETGKAIVDEIAKEGYTLRRHNRKIRTHRHVVKCRRRQHAGSRNITRRQHIRPESRGIPESTEPESDRNCHTYTDIPQANGKARQGLDNKLLVNGCLPPHHTCMRICSRKGRHQQFHSLHGN